MKKISQNELTNLLGGFIGVENAPARCGRGTSPNQFILKFENGKIFQSYSSVVGAKLNDGGLFFGKDHDYSNTTASHLTRWCGYSTKERRKLLEREEATLID